MRESRDPSGWRLAMLNAAALIGLAAHAAITGPEVEMAPPDIAMARVFHLALTGLAVFWLWRLTPLTAGRERLRRVTAIVLGLAIFAGSGLLARDFGII
ncbi:hypothetical protein JI664_05485 [Rhodobacter sp. NTK016B]|uniref:hypothetical protein n=1 Tax=Rhodobacter sp. NTK016B TaxID=2759676 RepID=UPI001A8D0A57|nr:hypothetical protein [Rhodobacter sp. NTK016B]MBN8291405.1 hypothetical protein [Rhodobacter sp. NTK016B]